MCRRCRCLSAGLSRALAKNDMRPEQWAGCRQPRPRAAGCPTGRRDASIGFSDIRAAMEIRQIRYALTVARERSFTRASQRLNISQSAISEQVKSLEGRIGFDLFRRTGRGVEMTELGRTFLGEAERVATDVLGLDDLARRLKGLGRDSFRLGIGSGLAPLFIPRMFAAGVLPSDLHVEISTAPTRVIFDELQAERLDLGLMIEVPPDRAPSGLAVTRMEEIEMVALATAGQKLPVVKSRLDV